MRTRHWLLVGFTLGVMPLGQLRAQTAVTMSGDCTAAASGVITCTKTNGVPLASAFDAAGAAAAEASRAQLAETAKMQYRGTWAASTAYAPSDVVLQAGVLYIAPAAFTSGASFSPSSWTTLTTVGAGASQVVPTPVSGNRTISAGDCGAILESGDSTAVTYTFPALSAGCSVRLLQGAAGQIAVAGSGVPLQPFVTGNSRTAGINARVEVYYDAPSTALLSGTTAQ